jgi:hypothetical protein
MRDLFEVTPRRSPWLGGFTYVLDPRGFPGGDVAEAVAHVPTHSCVWRPCSF